MNSRKNVARIVGALFVVDLVANAIGSTLVETVLSSPDYLVQLSANEGRVATGVLLEAICAACLIGIGVLLYPVLKTYSRTIALGYFGIRIVEGVIAASFLLSHLLLLALSREYVKAGAPDASYFETLGTLLKEGHFFSYQIYIVFYSMGCSMLYGLLFTARLVPRAVAGSGLIAVAVMFVGLVADMYGSGVGMETYGMPAGLFQIFLAVWLIVRGLDFSAGPRERSVGRRS